jgi:hypothetical protein
VVNRGTAEFHFLSHGKKWTFLFLRAAKKLWEFSLNLKSTLHPADSIRAAEEIHTRVLYLARFAYYCIAPVA